MWSLGQWGVNSETDLSRSVFCLFEEMMAEENQSFLLTIVGLVAAVWCALLLAFILGTLGVGSLCAFIFLNGVKGVMRMNLPDPG